MSGFERLKGFRTLSPRDRETVAAAAREVAAAKGTVLFNEGQPAEDVWAVKDGLVHIIKSGNDGREMVLEVIPPDELFGAVAALQSRSYPASAMTAEASVVWRVPAPLVRGLCQKHPSLRVSILEQVTERLRSAHERLRSVALEPVEQRLARVVLSLADKLGRRRGEEAVLEVTRQELADMIGSTVETTIRITSKWQRAGVVRSSRHELTLVDLGRLREIAGGA